MCPAIVSWSLLGTRAINNLRRLWESLLGPVSLSFLTWRIRWYKVVDKHFRNEKGAGAEMCPAIVSGIVTGHAPIPVPDVFAKVYSIQFPSRF